MKDALVLVALTVIPIAVVFWWGYGRSTDDLARAQALSSSERMADVLHALFARHRRSADELALLCSLEGPERCREPAMHATLLAIAPDEPSFRSLGLIHRDGVSLDIAPWTPNGRLLTEECHPEGALSRCHSLVWRLDGERDGDRPETVENRADPRTRDWYSRALTTQAGSWGPPVAVLVDGPRINRFRMTYSKPVPERPGEAAQTVSEVSVSLDDLLERIVVMQPSSAALTFITDAAGHPILLPKLAEFRGIEATPVGRAISPEFLPLAHTVIDAAAHADQRTLSINGEGYYSARAQLMQEPGIDWTITMALPSRDLLGGSRRVVTMMFGLAALALAIAVWRAVQLAHRFSAPLHALAKVTESLVEGEPVELPRTRVLEILDVGERFVRASTAIRERSRLEAELRHAQRLATIGTLTGGIVHDINNQLGAVQGLLDVLREERPEDEDLEVVATAAAACSDLTRGLLAFSRGSSAMQRRELAVNDLVTSSARLAGSTLRAAGVEIRVDLLARSPLVDGDRVLLEQVLMNLLLNARDAMPDGGWVSLSARPLGDDEVVLCVTDVGTGIDPAVRERIFDAFFTTKQAGEGTGLGLAMVNGIVAAHRGRLEIESEAGRGSTFKVILPVAARTRVQKSA